MLLKCIFYIFRVLTIRIFGIFKKFGDAFLIAGNIIFNGSLSRICIYFRATSIDYMSPNALNGSIMVNLFVSLIDRDEKQIGCNWLGFIKIPLSAVAQSSKVCTYYL